ncbi:13356_t:CDS:2 [Acaulospora morrowiae]|uniref:13356_t:CDS:1 n=1 Tax=Acaulospora morrowiae TaxID=94023 RepID=A0A9N9FBV5_9GLOM|nr:13356_t:CDS:2 [Acaulospora morrowiae]
MPGIFRRIFVKIFLRKRTQKNDGTNERSVVGIITTSDDTKIENLEDDNNNYNQNYNQIDDSMLRPISVNNNPADRLSSSTRRDWRSGYKPIDEFLQEMRLEYPHPTQHLNWVPFEEFVNYKTVAKGGFSTIYEATWTTSGQIVALKCLSDSQDISTEYLNELKRNWILLLQPQFLRCFGITQQPTTGEFMMVIQYAPFGDLRSHLQNNQTLSWKDKVRILKQIARGIGEMHKRDLVHGDLHSGNVMNLDNTHFVIADVGLCGPANKSTEKSGIYGVIPYLAPEVLKGQEHSKKSDVYSFAIIMWEICSGVKPYMNVAHDINLVNDILNGRRPPIPVGTPSFYSELMTSCWDADPIKRPDFVEISNTIYRWLVNDSLESSLRKNSMKSTIKNLSNKKTQHPDAVYHSRLLDFPEIKETRRRQYLSLNIPLSGQETVNESQTSVDESDQTQISTETSPNQSPSSPHSTNSFNRSQFRNSYNYPPTSRDNANYTPNSKEVYKFAPPKDAYSFLSHPPPIPANQNERTLSNSRVPNNVLSIFIPDDDIQTLQSFWATEGRNMSRKSLSNLI